MERITGYEPVDGGPIPLGDAIINPYSKHTYNVYVVGSIPTLPIWTNRSAGRSILLCNGSSICEHSSVGRAPC